MRPDIRLSTDFIVGFPGETDDDHALTMKLIDDIGFDASFSFIFSPRPGTPAAALHDDTPQAVKLQRLQQLQAAHRSQRAAHQRRARGHGAAHPGRRPVAQVQRRSPELMGRTECNRIVNFAGPTRLVGQMIDVDITQACPHSLRGRWPVTAHAAVAEPAAQPAAV